MLHILKITPPRQNSVLMGCFKSSLSIDYVNVEVFDGVCIHFTLAKRCIQLVNNSWFNNIRECWFCFTSAVMELQHQSSEIERIELSGECCIPLTFIAKCTFAILQDVKKAMRFHCDLFFC